jgi:hypothetical protein
VDIKKNPLGALGALASAGEDMEKFQKELEQMPATDPVHFSKLIEALPEAPAGWRAAEPKGSNNQMGDFKVSQASRRYQGSGNERVEVEISDWAYNRTLYLPFFMQAKFSQESTEGYSKGISVGTDPGREEYKFKGQDGARHVLHKKRYYIQVAVNNMPKEAIEEWWGKLRTASLP